MTFYTEDDRVEHTLIEHILQGWKGMYMENTYTVSFFGHREIEERTFLSQQILHLSAHLIFSKPYTEFLLGRNGEFDQIAVSSVRAAKKTFDRGNVSIVLVLPYLTAEYRDNRSAFESYYDEIEIFPEGSYFKSAIQKRNRHMVERSDLCVFYVKQNYGGAYQTLQYAKKIKKEILNLADMDFCELI